MQLGASRDELARGKENRVNPKRLRVYAVDRQKADEKDKEVGVVGYEIPFSRHFYEYEPPRPLAEIDAELNELSGEIMEMLQEVHS